MIFESRSELDTIELCCNELLKWFKNGFQGGKHIPLLSLDLIGFQNIGFDRNKLEKFYPFSNKLIVTLIKIN